MPRRARSPQTRPQIRRTPTRDSRDHARERRIFRPRAARRALPSRTPPCRPSRPLAIVDGPACTSARALRRGAAAARAPDTCNEQLPRALGRAEVGRCSATSASRHADERDVREVEPFAIICVPSRDVRFAARNASRILAGSSRSPRATSVSSRSTRLGELLRQLALERCVPAPPNTQQRHLALGTLLVQATGGDRSSDSAARSRSECSVSVMSQRSHPASSRGRGTARGADVRAG